jgi:ribosomal protein L37AE/L43A
MKRICSWCVPNHVLGVKCDSCGSKDCVKAADEELWLCIDCGSTFNNDVVTYGMCSNANLALFRNTKLPTPTKQLPILVVCVWVLIVSVSSLFAIVKAVEWYLR